MTSTVPHLVVSASAYRRYTAAARDMYPRVFEIYGDGLTPPLAYRGVRVAWEPGVADDAVIPRGSVAHEIVASFRDFLGLGAQSEVST